MAFHIAVFRRSDREYVSNDAPPVERDALEEWLDECDRRTLYEAPLWSAFGIDTYWSKPANRLGLPVISRFEQLFDEAFEVEGADLKGLRDELTVLEGHWLDSNLDARTHVHGIGTRSFSVPILVTLFERSNYLRSAIRIAERVDGYISIG